jgi:hypothetical protein
MKSRMVSAFTVLVPGALLVPLPAQQAGVAPSVAQAAKDRSERWQALDDHEPMWCQTHARALDWLQRHQAADGSWSAGPGNGDRAVAVTALALMALHSRGSTLRGGDHQDAIKSASSWLRQQDAGNQGSFSTEADGVLAVNALATWAAAESGALGNYTLMKVLALRAATRLAATAGEPAGFRRGDRLDSLQTAWAMAALLAAGDCKFTMPEPMRSGSIAFFADLTADSGRIGWQQKGGQPPATLVHGDAPSPLLETATAAGLYVQLLLGANTCTPIMARGVAVLQRSPPRWDAKAGTVDPIYWLFGARVAARAGGGCWQVWERALREQVMLAQNTAGDAAGSWPAVGPWAAELGEVGTTALIALALAAPCTEPMPAK